jgi:hypothetical protein
MMSLSKLNHVILRENCKSNLALESFEIPDTCITASLVTLKFLYGMHKRSKELGANTMGSTYNIYPSN